MRRSIGRIGASLALLLFVLSGKTLVSQPVATIYFENFLSRRFHSDAETPGWSLDAFCPVSTSLAARRVLNDYGAMFSAHESIVLPAVCIQPGEGAAIRYQKELKTDAVEMNGIRITLQRPAADKLRISIGETTERGSRITPLDGRIAGGRSYGETLMLWNSRFFPAMEFWVRRGVLSPADRDEIARIDLAEKIERVLEWESKGILFGPGRNRSILTSTAPPGASQHLALIALDVVEYSNMDVRETLNRNGWFQTIVDDPPHFTYLGFSESELPGRGLRPVYKGGYTYWVPNMSPTASVGDKTKH